jgi:hypothetical protein
MAYKLVKKLLLKSNDSFLLSLELYNKPTISYRAESFSLLFSNAWELLLKAYLLQKSDNKKLSIFRKKKRNQKRESISLDECLIKIFPNRNDPVRKNIEYISEIRNEAAHLIIAELDPYFSRVFQTGVVNYVRFLHEWFLIDINDRLNPGLVSLISDKNKIVEINLLRAKHNKEDFRSIMEWITKFKELEKLGEQATISIQHTIAIVKNPNKADYIISSGKQKGKVALIIEKYKDPDKSHPFNRKNAIIEIKKRLSNIKFNEYDFESYVFVKGCKKSNNEYYYKGKYSGAGQYSQKFIDEFVTAINKNNKNLKQWRSQYKQHLTRKV